MDDLRIVICLLSFVLAGTLQVMQCRKKLLPAAPIKAASPHVSSCSEVFSFFCFEITLPEKCGQSCSFPIQNRGSVCSQMAALIYVVEFKVTNE